MELLYRRKEVSSIAGEQGAALSVPSRSPRGITLRQEKVRIVGEE